MKNTLFKSILFVMMILLTTIPLIGCRESPSSELEFSPRETASSPKQPESSPPETVSPPKQPESPPGETVSPPKQPEPSPPEPSPSPVNLAGTVWSGTDSNRRYYEYHFMSDGKLHYRSPSGFYTDSATWWQERDNEGDWIFMEFNFYYTQRTGLIKGNRMEGVGWNQNSFWVWCAEQNQPGASPDETACSPHEPLPLPSSLAGTVWSGMDENGDSYEYHFMSDGKLHRKSPSGLRTNASWVQTRNHEGDWIFMEFNNFGSQKRGLIKGNRMEGWALNVKKNMSWEWYAERN